MSVILISDTHGTEINAPTCKYLVHLGDYESGNISGECLKILVRGNHDIEQDYAEFDLVVDGLIRDNILFTHEPVERLPKGCHLNIHGHLHDDDYELWGYKRQEFHRRLAPREVYSIEEAKLRYQS